MEDDQHLSLTESNEVPDVVPSSSQGRKKFGGRLRLQRYYIFISFSESKIISYYAPILKMIVVSIFHFEGHDQELNMLTMKVIMVRNFNLHV